MKKGNRIFAFLLCVLMVVTLLPATVFAAIAQTIEVPAEPRIGDIVRFGTYEQDNDTSNGAEEIEWQVLDIQGDKALIISKYALDSRPYHEETVPVTWETSTLRAWLNDDFLNTAFTASEQKSIRATTLSNPDHASFGTEGGNDTVDKVFLLSTDEANQYFASDAERIVYVTAYAFARGCYTCDQSTLTSYWSVNGDEYCSTASCWWWLRSPGFHTVYANSVHDNGQVIARSPGSDVRRGENAVRPAMWVDVEVVAGAVTLLPEDTAAGDTVFFGTYEQDNNAANGAEAIEWQVLDVQGGKAFLISKYALDCQPYHKTYEHVTWETSSIRAWLNDDFFYTAFTASERNGIAATAVTNPDSEAYGTSGGNDTTDKVFLLSIQETLKYFPEMEDRIAYPTAYAFAQGCYTLDVTTKNSYWREWGDEYCGTASCWWWQRSVGYTPVFAASCHDDGQLTLKSLGSDVRRSDTAVRPAMWVDLNVTSSGGDGTCALQAGAGSQEIVYPDAMFPVEGFSGEVHQNPYVRVLVLEQETRVAIVSYETVNVPSDVITQVKEIVSGATGTPVENIWVHATHAITTPHAPDDPDKRELFAEAMTEAVAAAAGQAAASFQPAVVGVGTGELDINANRDIKIGDSWYYGLGSDMASNKKMTVISFASLKGDPIGFFISYGIKPTAIDNAEMASVTRKISTDVPGVACLMMEEKYGVPAMFCMPCCGDQIPKETTMYYIENEKGEAELVERSVDEGVEIVERLGGEMGNAMIEIARSVKYTDEAQKIVAADTAFTWANKNGDGEVTIGVRGITIGGDIALIGIKPEANAVTEQELWAASPYPYTIVLSFLDGDQKYMPDAASHDLQTWEWMRSGTAKGSAEKFVEVAANLLEGIRSGEITTNTSSVSDAGSGSGAANVKTMEMGGVEWYVLDEQDGRALVVSKYVLETRAYHGAGGAVTWEDSEIRSYLNGEFCGKMFSAEEQARILATTIQNTSNSQYGIAGGNDTTDKVFLLSLNEAEKYMGSGVELLRGIDISTGEVTWWHLRSPGEATDVNASVNAIGLIDYHGVFDGVKDPTGGIRPAMWISTGDTAAPSSGAAISGEKAPEAVQTYTVAAGDCLWSIARKVYGNGAKWTVIYEENKSILEAANLIYAGQKLIVPAL